MPMQALSKLMKEVTVASTQACGGDRFLWPSPSPGGESERRIDPSLLHPSIPGTGVGSRNSRQQENNSTDCGGADSLGTVGCHGNRRKLILGSGTLPMMESGGASRCYQPPAFT